MRCTIMLCAISCRTPRQARAGSSDSMQVFAKYCDIIVVYIIMLCLVMLYYVCVVC